LGSSRFGGFREFAIFGFENRGRHQACKHFQPWFYCILAVCDELNSELGTKRATNAQTSS
jgi:hypothetical protein